MEKVILVDAWNTFVIEDGMNKEMYEMLEKFSEQKIILTNANDEQLAKLGIVDMPYEVFTMKHSPDKVDPIYYETLFEKFNLMPESVIYFEHSDEAVVTAKSLGINVHWYDKDVKDINALEVFLKNNIH